MKYVEAREVREFIANDSIDVAQDDMVMLETADGHMFAILSSYLAGGIGEIRSPYNDYALCFKTGVTGSNWENGSGNPVAIYDIEYIF